MPLVPFALHCRSRDSHCADAARVFVDDDDADRASLLLSFDLLVKRHSGLQSFLISRGQQLQTDLLSADPGVRAVVFALHKENIELTNPTVALLLQGEVASCNLELERR